MKLRNSAGIAAIIAGVFGVVALSSAPAQAQSYSRLVVFGDSLSDNGNLTWFGAAPPPPYYNGRFSNGPVWVEELGFSLQQFRTISGPNVTGSDDWAFGGARTDTLVALPPGIPTQIADYQGFGGTFSSSTLVTLWGGANDFFQGVAIPANQNPTAIEGIAVTAAGNMGASASLIAGAGAGTILVPNLPDLAVTPAFSTSPAEPLASIYSSTFNGALAANIAADAAAHPNTNFILMDVDTAFQYVEAHPSLFGIVDTDHACTAVLSCVTGSTATQDTFIFWDSVHPTQTGHHFLAELATEYLYYGNLGVPTAAEAEASVRHRGAAMDGAAGMVQGRTFEPGDPSVSLTVFGGSSQTDARLGGLMPTVKDSGGGGAVTLNVPTSEHFRWGVQLSGQQSDVKAGLLSFRDLSGGVDLYGGWRGSSGLFVNAVGGASVDQFTNINRVTMIAPLINTASTTGWGASAKLQGGWYFDMGGIAVSPRVAANFEHGSVQGYTEDGALVREAIATRKIDSTSGEATIRLEAGMGGSLHAYLEGGYRDYFSYNADRVTVSLPGNTAHALSTDVGKPDGGVALIDAGVSGHITNAISIGVGYQGRHSGSYKDDMGGVGIKMKF